MFFAFNRFITSLEKIAICVRERKKKTGIERKEKRGEKRDRKVNILQSRFTEKLSFFLFYLLCQTFVTKEVWLKNYSIMGHSLRLCFVLAMLPLLFLDKRWSNF